jgi:hypothetical protein
MLNYIPPFEKKSIFYVKTCKTMYMHIIWPTNCIKSIVNSWQIFEKLNNELEGFYLVNLSAVPIFP